MLLSISTAFSSEEGDDASQARCPSPFIIVNTFIEVVSPCSSKVDTRRSFSAPPSTRASERGSPLAYSLGKSEENSSGASTSAMDEDEITSCSGSCEYNGSFADEGDSPPPPSPEETEGTTLVLADLLGEPRQRAKLSAKAAAYAPSPCQTVALVGHGRQGLNLPPEVHRQLSEVMSVAETILLRENSVVQHVRCSENATGWTIVGSIHPTQAAYAKRVLASAGDQMLTSAQQCSNVHVIGAGANPFTPLYGGLGFSVQVAFLPNEAAACWNLLRKGFCARGHACRWQHPSWEATVNVQLNIVH